MDNIVELQVFLEKLKLQGPARTVSSDDPDILHRQKEYLADFSAYLTNLILEQQGVQVVYRSPSEALLITSDSSRAICLLSYSANDESGLRTVLVSFRRSFPTFKAIGLFEILSRSLEKSGFECVLMSDHVDLDGHTVFGKRAEKLYEKGLSSGEKQ